MLRRLLVVLVAGLVLFLSATAASAYNSSPWLNDIASDLADRQVFVRCLTAEESQADENIYFWGASGYVEGITDPATGRWTPKRYTVFAYGICEALWGIGTGDLRGFTVDDVAWAILVIVHESGHLRGASWSGSEALTQCWAMRNFRRTTALLGITDPEIQTLLLWFALQIHKKMPAEYRIPSCHLPTP